MASPPYEINLDIEKFKRELIIHEGRRNESFTDSIGRLTAGVGHVLTDVERVKFPEGTAVSEKQIDTWLESDIRNAYELAKTMFGAEVFEALDGVRKRAICNMAFSLGSRLAGFKVFIPAIKDGDYDVAANKLAVSKWYQQMKQRGQEIVEQIRNGRNIGRIASI